MDSENLFCLAVECEFAARKGAVDGIYLLYPDSYQLNRDPLPVLADPESDGIIWNVWYNPYEAIAYRPYEIA